MARPESRRVAVLGAGIMGASTALMLAREGMPVVLFDAAPAPFSGASRWNEGKIHLGHLYAADPSLATARRLLPGGLAFRPLVEALIGESLDTAVTRTHDTYLVHEDSVVDAAAMAAYLDAVTALAAAHPRARDYLADIAAVPCPPLTRQELEADYDIRRIRAGFRVPERSVDTQWVADRYLAALQSEPRITQRMRTRVQAVHRTSPSGPATVQTSGDCDGPFDFVVNALWQDRLRIDSGLSLPMPREHNHRYRVSVFLRTRGRHDLPSTVLATGPFGDVKNYDGRHFYFSWYRHGLQAEGNGVAPPPEPELRAADRELIAERTLAELGAHVRRLPALVADAEQIRTEGGWVYASGSGALDDREASLHRRDRVGIHRDGNYFSVDTGKYSIAPWLARDIADQILAS